MNTAVAQSELDHIATLADNAMAAAGGASTAVGMFLQIGDASLVREALEQARTARRHSEQILRRLLALGASHPAGVSGGDTLPLDMLDTPANRRFLAALEAAAEAGAEVDRERGWIDESGEPIGHGETLAGLALLARREIFGPEGKD